jgi:predicted enzyme related to lactoylglutathione lyase
MVQSLRHPVGTFCFMESGSVDVELTHRFYGGLFDWGVDEHSFPSGGSYTRFLMRDLPVAGVFSVEADQGLSLLPAQWWPFVSVESVETILQQAVALGAAPLGDVVDVPGEFTAAEFRDPSGAVCGLWQAGTHIGASFTGEAGALTWTDLSTADPSAAVSFYGELFGWTHGSEDVKSETYEFFTSDGAVVAGLARSDSADTPWWRPHVGVSDFDAAIAFAAKLGGDVGGEAPNVPGLGRRAAVKDPNGISLMLIESKT